MIKIFNKISNRSSKAPKHSEKVREFYNETTDKFLEVYGDIIQAFRTNNIEDYLDYTIKSAHLIDGEKILDAGCGVAGPAIYFSKKLPQLQIDACTISDIQYQQALQNVKTNELSQQINLHRLDYHLLDAHFESNSFDKILFLESFGHSDDKLKLLDACWEVLKPGGYIYIKDLFRRLDEDEWEQLRIDKICEEINNAYQYRIADLDQFINKVRAKGFILQYLKVPEIELSQFEHLTISNNFQNIFGIGKIESWKNYVFPIDFYEIYLQKPAQEKVSDKHLYFMNQV